MFITYFYVFECKSWFKKCNDEGRHFGREGWPLTPSLCIGMPLNIYTEYKLNSILYYCKLDLIIISSITRLYICTYSKYCSTYLYTYNTSDWLSPSLFLLVSPSLIIGTSLGFKLFEAGDKDKTIVQNARHTVVCKYYTNTTVPARTPLRHNFVR